MSSLPDTPERLHAPREDGEILSSPPLSQGVQLARENSVRLSQSSLTIHGRKLANFREWARVACLQRAREWMHSALGIDRPAMAPGLLFVTGHQPQLNHPGVWMKNVAVARLAECCGGAGLNLIVDNDLAGPPVIRCPGGTPGKPEFVSIPYDRQQPTQPWEDLNVQDTQLLASFPERVSGQLLGWHIQPSLPAAWPAVLQALKRTRRLGTLLSACRIDQEEHFGIANFELPVSELCQTDPFLAFVMHLCADSEQFFAAYNESVREYRQKYRVRNHRHPVPDLRQLQDRFELPFWYWQAGETDRNQLFARRVGEEIELSAGERILTRLNPTSGDLSPLRQLQASGRLRTRALTTTLFARLCLGDLFIHGIGGARYDEITDGILANYFDTPVPQFVTLTATLHLPLNASKADSASVGDVKNRLRGLMFSGADSLSAQDAKALEMRRAELLSAMKEERAAGYSRSERRRRRPIRRKRHLELKQIREQLVALSATEIAALEQELNVVRARVAANRVLQSREYPAALFPEEKLREMVANVRRQICERRW